MLYHIRDLVRDPHTRFTSFGVADALPLAVFNEAAFGYAGRPMWTGELSLGAPIQEAYRAPKIHVPLVKLYEYHVDRYGHPVYVERLCTRAATGLVPYKVRYRTPEYQDAFVSPRLLTTIHTDYSGLVLTDPRNQIVLGNDRITLEDDLEEILAAVREAAARQGGSEIDVLCPDAYTLQRVGNAVQDMLMPLIRTPCLDDWAPADFDDYARDAVLPRLPLIDPVMFHALNGPLGAAYFHSRTSHGAPIDLTPPLPVPIHHPEVTLLSPYAFSGVAELLEELLFTDVQLRYVIRDGVWGAGRHIDYAVDRYRAPADHLDVARLSDEIEQLFQIDRAAHEAVRQATLHLTAQQGDAHPLRNARILIRKTSDEEALVEFSPLQHDVPFLVVHFDLALLSLCSLGVATHVSY